MTLPKKPEYFAGIKIDGAGKRYFERLERLERLEREEKAKSESEIKPEITPTNVNINDFIYVPSANCYLAKQRTHLGADWNDCHKQLHQESLLMPTIPQFISYINYLKANPNGTPSGDATKEEIASILDDILTFRAPWRAEWLDAFFTKQNNQLYINYNYRTDSNGNLTPKNSEPLEKCLIEDGYADVLNGNKQGLPTKKSTKGKGIYYWHPRENYVARFSAGSDGAYLKCYGDPSDWDSGFGVFGVCEANAVQRKI